MAVLLDGRDIGTVIAPGADAKIFVTSSAFHASVTLRRCVDGSIFSSASRPMKSWSNFTNEP